MNLEEFSKNRMKEAQTISFTGIILKSEIDGMIIIIPCFCVQDTKNNPCRCTEIKILISKADIVGDIESLDQKSIGGEKLSSLTVKRDANILVEQTTSIKAENAKEVARTHIFPPIPPIITLPPFLPPTFPVPNPDPENPDVVYFWPAVIAGGAALGAAAVGGYYAIRGNNCTTTTTTTETTSSDGTKVTKTVVEKKCG